jgi:hypothetical protein
MNPKTVLSRLKRCLTDSFAPTRAINGTVTIADCLVTDLKLLGGYQRPGITKAGRLSFQGVCNGQKVKVYSFHTPEQAELRLQIQQQSLKGCCFPEIVAADQNLVAEAWIEGVSFESLPAGDLRLASENVSLFLNDIHQSTELAAFANQHLTAFCYFEDYLLKRLGVWINWSPIKQFMDSWQEQYRVVKPLIPRRLSHPDLSKANLIRENSSGRIFVIDNELLGVGPGWILDKKNSFLCNDLAPDSGLENIPADFIETSWKLRRIGSALDAGNLSLAAKLAS